MPDSKLRVFLCHSSHDKPAVRELYQRLKDEGWIDPWLDEEKLLPGQDWDLEIEKAVEAADAVIVFLSNNSVTKEGYVQRELRFVLRIADFKSEGTVFVIPVRLDDCPMPRRLSMWQYVDCFPEDRKDWAYNRLLGSLKVRARNFEFSTIDHAEEQAHREAEERARKDKEERESKEREEKARREKEAADKAAKEKAEWEVAEKAAKEKAEQERIARENLQAEERARLEKEAEEKARQVVLRKERQQARIDNIKKFFSKNGKHFLFIGGGIVLLFLFGYVIRNIELPVKPEPTKTPTTSIAVTATLKPPTSLPISTTSPTEIPAFGVGSTMTSEKDGMVLVYVPAGEFQMGSESDDADEMPVHAVYLDAFWIDQVEVTNALYARCVEAGICNAPKFTESNTRDSYYKNPIFDDFPVIFVSWDDAKVYCEWVGRRLPTEAEWEKAASWDNINKKKNIYPWGDSINCSLANYRGCTDDTTEVGSYEDGQSPYGALDMAGNVWEWVADWYDPTYYQNSLYDNPIGPNSGSSRVQRGGSWYNPSLARCTDRAKAAPSISYSIALGFRCATSE